MKKIGKCMYCRNPTTKENKLCSENCEMKWKAKEERVFVQNGGYAVSQPLSADLKKLQEEFLEKKVG